MLARIQVLVHTIPAVGLNRNMVRKAWPWSRPPRTHQQTPWPVRGAAPSPPQNRIGDENTIISKAFGYPGGNQVTPFLAWGGWSLRGWGAIHEVRPCRGELASSVSIEIKLTVSGP